MATLPLLLCLSYICPSSISEQIVCNETTNCAGTILQCQKKYEDCSFLCVAEYGCLNATFICPPTVSLCTVECASDHSCESTNIICARNSECHIIGNGKYALANSKINGPYLQTTNIQCKNDYACKQAWIDARHSANLNLLCHTNTQFDGCHDITLYCPYYEYLTKHPSCNIQQSRTRPPQSTEKKLTFYARNSWNDLHISWDISVNLKESQMFCGDDYQYLCNIQSELIDSESSKYEWNCANEHSLCYVRKESIAESELWKGDAIMTVLFVLIFTVILALSCRYGRKSFMRYKNSKNVKMIKKAKSNREQQKEKLTQMPL